MNTNTLTSTKLYENYHQWKGWRELFAYTPDSARYFVGELSGIAIAGAHVLEIGFGSGDFLQWASEQGANLVGTEINAASLEAARQRGIRLIDAQIERVADNYAGTFDTIVAFDVFEHFSNEEIVARIGAANIMLKNGGHLLLRFPNAQSPFGLVPQNGDPTHKSMLSLGALEPSIARFPFEIVEYRAAFTPLGGSLRVSIVRMIRRWTRKAISKFLNFTFATQIPYDPVVVLILRKAAG